MRCVGVSASHWVAIAAIAATTSSEPVGTTNDLNP